jgi:uncharacterized protein
MERTLYNGLISGVSLDGKSFFYPNPLESSGQHERSPWFGCACCPGNITRFLASVPGYVYAQQRDNLYVNLFVGSTADIKMDGASVHVAQETRYPWDGAVKITVTPKGSGYFTIRVRIPGWARNEASPAGLYAFTDNIDAPVVLKVNGQPVPLNIEKGYVAISRQWKAGDVIHLNLPMPVRRVVANEAVVADRGRVALQRGPIVYCAEWPDNPGGHVRNLVLPRNAVLKTEFRPDLLKGVVRITGGGLALVLDKEGKVHRKQQPMTAIPYYAWAHRGPGEMLVWLPETEASGRPLPVPTIASTARVTSSVPKNTGAIRDGEIPRASREHNPYGDFDWSPKKGTTEWVEYSFAKPTRVSSTAVYWIDSGDCKAPKSWRVLYQEGTSWKPVENRESYTTARDRFNNVTFAPVVATGLRLEVAQEPEHTAGIHEWKVE